MGIYATSTSLPNLIPNALAGNTTGSGNQGTIDSFSKSIDKAEAKVNAAISRWYDVSTFTTTSMPPALADLTEDLALYLFVRGNYTQEGGIKQEYTESYKLAIEDLALYQKGEKFLVYTNGSLVARRSNNYFQSSTATYSSTTFDLDDERNWDVDQQRLDDIAANRN